MGRFIHTWDDAYLYEKECKDKFNVANPRCHEILLSAHGTPSTIIIDRQHKSAMQLLDVFNDRVPYLHNYKYIRLACCYSAMYRQMSLACQLSLILQNHYIKGYVNYIDTNCQPDAMNRSINEVGITQASREMTNLLLEYRFVTWDRDFHSIIYYRGQIMKQKMDSPEGVLRL